MCQLQKEISFGVSHFLDNHRTKLFLGSLIILPRNKGNDFELLGSLCHTMKLMPIVQIPFILLLLFEIQGEQMPLLKSSNLMKYIEADNTYCSLPHYINPSYTTLSSLSFPVHLRS